MGKTLKFEMISKLNREDLIGGVKALYDNAQNLLKAGKLLSESGHYGTAIALVVLATEELIKSNALFLVLTEASDEELFNAAFNSRNLHSSRLKLAEGISISNNLMNENETIKALEEASEKIDFDFDKMSPQEILKMEWLKEFMLKFQSSPDINRELTKIMEEIVPKAESRIQEQTNWFVSAQSQKEKGMYVDFTGGTWVSPSDVTKDDFHQAYSNATLLFDTVGKPLNSLTSSNSIFRNIYIDISKGVINETKNRFK